MPVATLPDPPWEHHPRETPLAFASFVAFRDLGPDRSIIDAYRLKTGRKSASRATGIWNFWVSEFRWWERAQAYDNHLEARRRRTIERAEQERLRRWVERRDEGNEALWELGHELRRHCLHVFRHPVLAEVPHDDGSTALVECYSAHQVRAATGEAEMANTLIRQALADMLGATAKPDAPGAAPPSAEEIGAVAGAMLDAFRARNAGRKPPDGPPDGPEPSDPIHDADPT